MKIPFYLIIRATAVLLLLLFVSSCDLINPRRNERQDEPDTANSYARAFVRAPGMSTLWEVRNLDTLFRGTVGVIEGNGILSTRSRLIIRSSIYCNFTQGTSQNFITISITKNSNLQYSTYTNPITKKTDSLLSWYTEEISFFLDMPNLKPIVADTVNSFSWKQIYFYEQYAHGTNGEPQIWTFNSVLNDTQYADTYLRPGERDPYKTTIQSAFIAIDSYDEKKKRVSGRFRFKVVDRQGQEIDIRDGIFQNVAVFQRKLQ